MTTLLRSERSIFSSSLRLKPEMLVFFELFWLVIKTSEPGNAESIQMGQYQFGESGRVRTSNCLRVSPEHFD